jgi:hypothetical protein
MKPKQDIIKELREHIRDFWEFMDSELGAIREGVIDLNDKTNMLQSENIARHFELFQKECVLVIQKHLKESEG